MPELNPKQEQFCQEYLIDLNATQAAVRAGYSTNGADVQAARLLGNVRIQERIQELKLVRAERVEITQDMIVSELRAIGFENTIDYVFKDEEGTEVVRTFPIKVSDKTRALELLGRHIGMWPNKVEVKDVTPGERVVFMVPKNGSETATDGS